MQTNISAIRAALANVGIDPADSALLDDALELQKCLPDDQDTVGRLLAAASILELTGGGADDRLSVNITGDGTSEISFPEGIRGTLTFRGTFDGASINVKHKEAGDGAGTGIFFKHPLTGADLVVTDEFSMEFVMPSGGVFDLTTSGSGAGTNIDVVALSIKN